jgi:MMP 1-O-methyltransferase
MNIYSFKAKRVNETCDDVKAKIERGVNLARPVPGFLLENEMRFLGTLAACIPARGATVEIGSYKGRSTVMLAHMAAEYDRGPVVAIDPHEGLSYLGEVAEQYRPQSFDDFLKNIRSAGVHSKVEVRRARSGEVARQWDRPIRLLWIDGDHTYSGCSQDFALFSPYLVDGAVVAFHDALSGFDGPIRVFVEQVLRSDRFGPAGFVHSIAWSQFRPTDGAKFRDSRRALDGKCARLIPFVRDGQELRAMRKRMFKLLRWRIPKKLVTPEQWLASIGHSAALKVRIS